ncbi:hypothetical protein X975_12423, partial [Stegodyphus mimosarum]
MPPITPSPTDIPDDSGEQESTSTNDFPVVMVVSDSDSISDEGNFEHDGYELLSQDPDNSVLVDSDPEEDSNFTLDQEECGASATNTINHHFLLPAPSNDSTNSEVIDPPKEEMNEDLIETIKSVMKGITLPTSNLPQWAHLVPEEEWKAALLSEMHSRKLRCSKDCENNCTPSSERDNEPDDQTDVLR